VQFNATVQNAPGAAVNWSVNNIPGGNLALGTIDSNGNYMAPAKVPSPPTVMIVAAWQSDTAAMGSSSVTILSPSSIQGPLSISPALASVTTSQSVQFQVTTAGIPANFVNWSVSGFPNGNATVGTITPGGLYTPPGIAGSQTIIASIIASPSALGSAQVVTTNLGGNFTWRNDNSRSGQNSQELALAPSTVNSSNFGKLFSCLVDGYIYTQPLYVANLPIPGMGTHNVVLVATENDSVYAFDADASPCAQLWQVSLIPSGQEAVSVPNLDITTTELGPLIGITGTPVIDGPSSTLFVVAESQTIAINSTYYERLYALDLATGNPEIQPNGVQVFTPANYTPTFSSLWENQRGSLLLDNGTLFIPFGSHGGLGAYHGWVMAYTAATLDQSSALNDTLLGMQGGIDQSAGGPSADSNHNIYVSTRSGTFDAYRGGQDYGNSFLRLALNGGLAVTGYFTPCDAVTLTNEGVDLGTSAMLLLPALAGTAQHPDLMVGAGANGSMYLIDRDTPGGYDGGICPDTTPRPLQVTPVNGPVLSTPLYWNNGIYVAPGGGNLEVFPLTSGVLSTTPLPAQSPESLGPQGATPVMSSNGTSNGIVWLIDASGANATPNTPAILRAYDANNLSNEIYNSAANPARDSAGLAETFTVPTVANAKVYVGTQGELDVYGLLQ
jgi:hypothetical protein